MMPPLPVVCVYAIDLPDRLRYVGATVNYRLRRAAHLTALRKGNHANGRFVELFRRYGEGALSWGILELLSDGADADEIAAAEVRWMHRSADEGFRLVNPQAYTYRAGLCGPCRHRSIRLPVAADEAMAALAKERRVPLAAVYAEAVMGYLEACGKKPDPPKKGKR